MKKLVLILFSLVLTSTFAQQVYTFSGGNNFLLPEITAMISEENNKIKFVMIPPLDKLDKEYQKLDLKKDDEIIFFNGKKIKNIDELKKIYEAVKVGDELKLGIQRGDSKHIVAFKKIDAKDIKGVKTMTFSNGDKKINPGDLKVKDGKVFLNGKEVKADSVIRKK